MMNVPSWHVTGWCEVLTEAKQDAPPGPTSRRRLPAEERREQIRHVAQEVFLEMGFAGARTKDIASRAGLAEAVLYRHFASKEEMFEAAILEPLEGLVEELVAHADTAVMPTDPAEHLARATALHEHRMRVMLEVAPLWVVAIAADDGSEDGFYRRKLEPLIDRWCDALRPWFHYDNSNRQLRHIGLALLGIYGWIGLDVKAGGRELSDQDIRDVSADVAEILFRGMGLAPREQGTATKQLSEKSTQSSKKPAQGSKKPAQSKKSR